MFCGSDLCTFSSHFQEILDSDAEETDYTGRGGGTQQEKARSEPERAQVPSESQKSQKLGGPTRNVHQKYCRISVNGGFCGRFLCFCYSARSAAVSSIRRHKESPLVKLRFQANPGTALSGALRSTVGAQLHVGPVLGIATSLRVYVDMEGVVGTVLTGALCPWRTRAPPPGRPSERERLVTDGLLFMRLLTISTRRWRSHSPTS